MVQGLVAAALSSNPAEVSELTTLVYLRNQGNPYFSIELLKSLYKDGLLAFNRLSKNGTGISTGIEEYGIASNVVDFLVNKIRSLDEDTQKTLQYAA